MIKTIPLNKLVPSPRNVRRATDEQADVQLKADIAARGLLQNLVVASTAKPRGCYSVEAGGRRLRALQGLADEGTVPATHEVCCLVLDRSSDAREASLAENFQRLSMNPADECLAFQQLIEQGSDVEGVARRFGLTSRFVEGRLRLATLAPVVFDALGSGDISLEVAKAYAATPDQERQAYVFEQMGRGYGGSHPDSIRRLMTQATASAIDRRARFVGEEAYVAAGGRIERDLFADDEATRWLDVAILERLANEKLKRVAAEAAAEAGLAWVKPTLDRWVGHDQTEGLRRVPVPVPPLTDDEVAHVDDLEGMIEDLVVLLEDEDTDDGARDEAEAKIRVLSDQIEAITSKPPVVDEALKASVGAFLILDEEGRPKMDAALYTEALLPGGACVPVDSPAGAITGRSQKNGGLSQRLVDELAMQRRDILAAHVAADPALALDLVIFLMADREPGYQREKSGSSLIAAAPQNPVFDFKTPDAPATIARAQAADALDRSWSAGDTRAARFDAFRALPEEARAGWLAYAASRTLEASLNLPGERNCRFHDHLGQVIGIDVARWWRPSGANFFDRVSKGVTLAALADVGGDALAARYSKAKKAELAQSCERIFSGDFIAEVEVKEAAIGWVPEVMRFAPAPASATDGEAANTETAQTSDDPTESGLDSGDDAGQSPVEEAA